MRSRKLSLAHAVAEAGGIDAWNKRDPQVKAMLELLSRTCTAKTVAQALEQVDGFMALGHLIWAYAYMRMLYHKNADLYFATLLAAPQKLMPVVYTPTVGEACQKFGHMPQYERGCYVSITHRGRVAAVLREYAAAHLQRRSDGTYACECIVFSDGGRILGLGDLGAWGMGIPIGKLDLYTVCAGLNPARTVPVILDAGVAGREGNTARLEIRGDTRYTGLRRDRDMTTSAAGTQINSCYYGADSFVDEFMAAAVELFGPHVLLQFEDFNSNDAFPLLAAVRGKYLTYNDDIQGTAAVTVAGILGGLRLRHPGASDLVAKLREQTYLFHGAGSANVGAASLLIGAAGVPRERVFMTNSRGLIWRAASGGGGSYRNDEQRGLAHAGKPSFAHVELVDIVRHVQPSVLVGAVGRQPGCFSKAVVEALLGGRGRQSWAQCWSLGGDSAGAQRPIMFALSNPKTQAEITASDAYTWSAGRVIFGSGTSFDPVSVAGAERCPGQVNNVYVFPGLSFGAVSCQASTIPDELFLAAAEAVAGTLSEMDIRQDRVVPHPDRIREVGLNVAAATAWRCQQLGLASRPLGDSLGAVRAKLKSMMWTPSVSGRSAKL